MDTFADGFLKPEPRTGSDGPGRSKKADTHQCRIVLAGMTVLGCLESRIMKSHMV